MLCPWGLCLLVESRKVGRVVLQWRLGDSLLKEFKYTVTYFILFNHYLVLGVYLLCSCSLQNAPLGYALSVRQLVLVEAIILRCWILGGKWKVWITYSLESYLHRETLMCTAWLGWNEQHNRGQWKCTKPIVSHLHAYHINHIVNFKTTEDNGSKYKPIVSHLYAYQSYRQFSTNKQKCVMYVYWQDDYCKFIPYNHSFTTFVLLSPSTYTTLHSHTITNTL